MLYSYYTRDRSGAQLLNILQNYYYCFKNNLKYGGPVILKIKNYHYKKTIKVTEPLVRFLNLPISNNNNDNNFEIINKNIKSFDNEFRELLYNQVKPNLIKIHKKSDDFVICLHIRRGDVQKNNRWKARYTDDEYYFELINEIKIHKPNSKIYLFSEKYFKGEENYNKYVELGCIIKLDTSLTEAFNYFIQCDIFIMASSSFSIVPAIYKKHGLIIYTWNKYFKPLDGWIYGEIDSYNVLNIEEKKVAIKNYINNFKN